MRSFHSDITFIYFHQCRICKRTKSLCSIPYPPSMTVCLSCSVRHTIFMIDDCAPIDLSKCPIFFAFSLCFIDFSLYCNVMNTMTVLLHFRYLCSSSLSHAHTLSDSVPLSNTHVHSLAPTLSFSFRCCEHNDTSGAQTETDPSS